MPNPPIRTMRGFITGSNPPMAEREAADVKRAFRFAAVLGVVGAAVNIFARWHVDDLKTRLYGGLGVLVFVIVFGFLVLNAVFSVQRRMIRRRGRRRIRSR